MRLVSCLTAAALVAALNGCGGGGGDVGSNSVANLGSGVPASDGTGSGTPGPGTTETGGTGSGSTDPGGTGSDGLKEEMVAAINQARSIGRSCGATYYGATTPVSWDDKVAAAALAHSTDMVANGFFSHTGSDGSSPGDRLSDAGYVWSAYGENIAVGYSTAASVVQAWLASEGHCRNIMNPTYEEIGAGAAVGSYNGSAAMRYWTLDMGRQM